MVKPSILAFLLLCFTPGDALADVSSTASGADTSAGASFGIIIPAHSIGPHAGPVYPEDSVRNAEEGTVLVGYTIREDGTPADPTVLKSSGFPRLDQAALATVMNWKFTPASKGGQPIISHSEVNIVFRLEDYDVPSRPFNIVQMDLSDVPDADRDAIRSGDTWLLVTIDESGAVAGTNIMRSSGSASLDQAAMAKAVGRWHFGPATRDGKPIRSLVMLDIRWPSVQSH